MGVEVDEQAAGADDGAIGGGDGDVVESLIVVRLEEAIGHPERVLGAGRRAHQTTLERDRMHIDADIDRHCRVSSPELGISHPERPATGLSWEEGRPL